MYTTRPDSTVPEAETSVWLEQMEDSCKNCRNWEEEIFWTHFQSIHFSQLLHGDFLQRLEIPENFAKNVKKRLPETVTLKGPSGVIWDVGLTADDDVLFFDGGWTTFVKDHLLIDNDFLIFKYNGVSHFDVLMFDGKSLCEKPSSYFVRKCMHTESHCEHQTKRKASENPDEILHNSSRCGLESSPEKSTNNDTDARPSTKAMEYAASNNKKKIQNSDSGTRSIMTKRSLGGKQPSTFPVGVKVERLETDSHDSEHEHTTTEYEHTTTDGDAFGSLWHATGKRVATRAEKMNVLLKAQEAVTDEGFMVVMKPTHVDRKFYMSIPIAWVVKHLFKTMTDVVLRMNERTWRTRFFYHRNRKNGGFSGGWRKFVKDNNIEERDVCVFEPANIGSKPIILDVSIFRVLPPAVHLRRVNHPPSSPPDKVDLNSTPDIVKVIDASSLRAGK
ncbi:AP2/B3-like transcriptional factor family protein, putative isoform 2 [Hibiscus syriacus]|uniref:AP2/B3-like transcriptional factor family protein, putative isoform 2 n=2 Tax=Hibiscus syriacus TaxID=106335 RepID=A0A6A2WW40_HIBSY|nr:AP2/B3-like transcriptional factor family protein, putative isoform 2 [Hibiscus syriacus]